jgi:hypothetical protein
MSTNAFNPCGNTVTFVAATTPPTPVQAVANTLGAIQYRLVNAGTVTVFIGVGPSADGATANAVVASSSQNCYPLLPGAIEIATFLPNAYFTANVSSGTATVYVTPGDGL